MVEITVMFPPATKAEVLQVCSHLRLASDFLIIFSSPILAKVKGIMVFLPIAVEPIQTGSILKLDFTNRIYVSAY